MYNYLHEDWYILFQFSQTNRTILNQNHQVHCFLCNGFPCEKCASLPTECTCISTEHENENVSTCCKECGEILPVANQRSITCKMCGYVAEEFFQQTEWVDSQRCSVLTNSFRMSGNIKSSDGKQSKFINIIREEYNSRISRYNLGVRELTELCRKAHIQKGCLIFIKHHWMKYIDLKVSHKSVNRQGVFLYCIFVGCMESGFTRTINEICIGCGLPISYFRRGEKIMRGVKIKKGETESDFFYSRFIRLVQIQQLDFFYADEMNNVFNQVKHGLLCFSNDIVTLSIFCWVLQLHFEFDVSQIAKRFNVNLMVYPEIKKIIESCKEFK